MIAIAFLSVGLIAPIQAHADQHEPLTGYIAIDALSGRVLLSENPDQQVHPASLTKMMTLYLLFDAVQRRRLKMGSRIRFSRNAARQPPSKLGVRYKKSITVKTAILALAVKSANDVAVAVAERLAGSEKKFAARMNAKARALGMSRTNFVNASGLHDPLQISTPRDLARLSRGLLYKHKRYYKYFKVKRFKHGRRTYRTHNRFIALFDGADGIKTGYVRASGFNLAGSAVRKRRRLIGVIVGGKSGARRDLNLVGVMDAGFRLADGIGKPRNAGIAPVAVDWRTGRIAKPPRRPGTSAPKARRPPRRATPGVASRSPGSGIGYAAQVGAVTSKQAAARLADDRLRTLGSTVVGGIASVAALKLSSGRYLYRARIAGLTGQQARNACSVLRKARRDCLVVGPPRAG
ncbi:MAG: serine hydrolase [Alphaproteobacteria bacterium]